MKVPTMDEIMDTFDTAWGACPSKVADDCDRAGLLAVFETHVKGMLAEAYIEGHVDCQKRVMDVSGNDYANRIIAQLKQPRHD